MIARAEWRWLGIAALLVVTIARLPVLIGYAVQTPDQRFLGAVYDVQDYNSHLAKMQLGGRGEFYYRSLFTPEPHPGEPIIYFYIVLGSLARWVGLPLVLVYEVMHVGGGLVLLSVMYRFIARCVDAVGLRRLIFVLTVATGGVGWLLISTPAFSAPNQSPMEFWLADGYLLFSIMAFPHFCWSIAAQLAAYLAWQDYAERGGGRLLAAVLMFSAALGFIQIFELALLDVVIGLDALRRLSRNRGQFRSFALAGSCLAILQLLMVWPYLNATQTNPLVQDWSQQSQTLSPPPLYYLLGYGLLWPLIGLGLGWVWRQRAERLAFPAIWLGAVALLVYSPNGIQYRWLEGVQLPLSIFAGLGLSSVAVPWLVSRVPERWRSPRAYWWITALSVIALMPSSLYLIAGNSLLAAVHWEEVFISGGEAAAIEWLAANAQPDDTVLAGVQIGNALPGWIGQRTFYGHWAETMNFKAKGQAVKSFFSDMPDSERQELLDEYGIYYVFHGPTERGFGSFAPDTVDYLTRRYQNDEVSIYEVRRP